MIEIQRRLEAASSEETKIWWEKYLRGAAAFRGVGIPQRKDERTDAGQNQEMKSTKGKGSCRSTAPADDS